MNCQMALYKYVLKIDTDFEVFSCRKVYLDYNATTPLEEEVQSAITDSLRTAWGNPSSAYPQGIQILLAHIFVQTIIICC